MIMLGLWFTDESPFHTVYLHGLVRDATGRKISKTLGNTIDPLDLIDQYGADPLRFTLLTSGTPGNDVNLDTKRVEGEWRFVNKLWQITNFVVGNLADAQLPIDGDHNRLDLPSRWILSRLNTLIDDVQRLFDSYQYGEAGRQIRSFLWDEFADWYLEISKRALYGDDTKAKESTLWTLTHTLGVTLRLLHPFMPFVTEEAWSYLETENEPLICAAWPIADETLIDAEIESNMNILMELVRGIRVRRTEYGVEPSRKIKALIAPGVHQELLNDYGYMFGRLCNVDDVTLLDNESAQEDSVSIVFADITMYLPLSGLVDIEAECNRLAKEKGELENQIDRTKSMLANENFVNKANPEVVQRERDRLADLLASAERVQSRIDDLC